jgi:hypothetical protein
MTARPPTRPLAHPVAARSLIRLPARPPACVHAFCTGSLSSAGIARNSGSDGLPAAAPAVATAERRAAAARAAYSTSLGSARPPPLVPPVPPVL